MPTYVQCKATGKFVLKADYYGPKEQINAPTVHGDFKEFISPIDKTPIVSRQQLNRHMSDHGVTVSSDYSDAYIAKRATARGNEGAGRTAKAKEERVQLIKRTLEENGYAR